MRYFCGTSDTANSRDGSKISASVTRLSSYQVGILTLLPHFGPAPWKEQWRRWCRSFAVLVWKYQTFFRDNISFFLNSVRCMEESQGNSDPRKYQQSRENFNLEAFCRITASVVAYWENVVALDGGLLFHILNQYHASSSLLQPSKSLSLSLWLFSLQWFGHGHCHRFFHLNDTPLPHYF